MPRTLNPIGSPCRRSRNTIVCKNNYFAVQNLTTKSQYFQQMNTKTPQRRHCCSGAERHCAAGTVTDHFHKTETSTGIHDNYLQAISRHMLRKSRKYKIRTHRYVTVAVSNIHIIFHLVVKFIQFITKLKDLIANNNV